MREDGYSEYGRMHEGQRVFRVAVDDIKVDPVRLQIRHNKATEKRRIAEYANKYQNGEELPPLTVVKLEDGFYLSDGFHRYEALRMLGRTNVDVIQDTQSNDADQAKWESYKVNAEHGKSLKSADHREAFKVYMKLGKHWKNRRNGEPKCFTEIIKDLPGVSEKTVRRWMKQDFPQIYRRFTGKAVSDEIELTEDFIQRHETDAAYRHQKEAVRLVRQAVNIIKGIKIKGYAEEAKAEALALMQKTLSGKKESADKMTATLETLEAKNEKNNYRDSDF